MSRLFSNILALSITLLLGFQTTLAAQSPQADQAALPEVELSLGLARLLPKSASFYVEIAHVGSLAAALGVTDKLLDTANNLVSAAAADESKESAGTARASGTEALTAKELNTLLDSSAAIAFLGERNIGNPSAAIALLRLNSDEAITLLRKRVFARAGAPLSSAHVYGVDLVRMRGFSYASSGRSVLVGAGNIVEETLKAAVATTPHLADDQAFAYAQVEHAAAQEQAFAYLSGSSLGATIGGAFGIGGIVGRDAGRKASPEEDAMRTFAGLEAIQGLAVGMRVEMDGVHLRYNVAVDRTHIGLVTMLTDPPPIAFRASTFLPADTDRLTVFSLDGPRIYDLFEQAFATLPASPGTRTFADELAEMEHTVGVNIRSELLPALGTEFAYTGSLDESFGGEPDDRQGAKRPVRVIVLQVVDPEVARKVIGNVFRPQPDTPLSPVQYKGVQIWELPGSMSAALGPDYVLVGSASDLRRCVDAQVSGEVLARSPEYAAKAGGWGGDTLFATYESAQYRDAAAKADQKRQDELAQAAGPKADPDVLEMTSMQGLFTSSFPSIILRDGTGIRWDATVTSAPVAALCAYVMKTCFARRLRRGASRPPSTRSSTCSIPWRRRRRASERRRIALRQYRSSTRRECCPRLRSGPSFGRPSIASWSTCSAPATDRDSRPLPCRSSTASLANSRSSSTSPSSFVPPIGREDRRRRAMRLSVMGATETFRSSP